MSKFIKSLEEKAELVASVPKRDQWDKSIPSIVRREIALTVDQIKRLKQCHEEQFLRLLQIECYVNTELMQMEQRMPKYSPCRFPEREKFQKRLFEIEKERRNLSLKLEEKTQGLENHLLSLINKYEQLEL